MTFVLQLIVIFSFFYNSLQLPNQISNPTFHPENFETKGPYHESLIKPWKAKINHFFFISTWREEGCTYEEPEMTLLKILFNQHKHYYQRKILFAGNYKFNALILGINLTEITPIHFSVCQAQATLFIEPSSILTPTLREILDFTIRSVTICAITITEELLIEREFFGCILISSLSLTKI